MNLVNYIIANADSLPPIETTKLYEYVFAANGAFVRARRGGLEALLPVRELYDNFVRGLNRAQPYVTLLHPKVPASILEEILQTSLAQRAQDSEFVDWLADELQSPLPILAADHFFEIVFHLVYTPQGWITNIPEQEQSEMSVLPKNDAGYEKALIELHSHHSMDSFFSPIDDSDETGFRIYAVLGNIQGQATLRVRVGIYGHHWEIPAAWIFELPEGVQDALSQEDFL